MLIYALASSIRQWRQAEQPIGPPPEPESAVGKQSWPELPMPRDFHLLPLVSQHILRAARAGRLYPEPSAQMDDEDKANLPEEEEVKETPQGFVAKRWVQVPTHLEEPEREHLAKRRKGLPPISGNSLLGTIPPAAATRKTKVRKVDAEGNVHIYEVLAPEGQTIEGEVVEEDEAVKAAPIETAAAPGTVVEGVGVVNEQGVVVANDLLAQQTPRRKPPPRRKPKRGPGRGRKKVLFEAGTEGAANGDPSGSAQASDAIAIDGIANSAGPSVQGDTPMPDADAQDGDDDEGSGSEEGEEGEDDDDGDREEGELSPTPEPESVPSYPLQPALETEVVEEAPAAAKLQEPAATVESPIARDASSSPELPLASKVNHSRQGSVTEPSAPTSEPANNTEASVNKVQSPAGQAEEVDLFGSLEQALENKNNDTKVEEETTVEPGTKEEDAN
jgi:hypothetical protein